MNKYFKKAYLLREAKDGRELAVVTHKRGLLLTKNDSRLITKEFKDDAFALVELEAATKKNGGRINLSTSRKYNVSEKEYKLVAEYRLHTDNNLNTGQSLREFLCYTNGSQIDMLVINCEDIAKCIVRCDEYFVYATKDISTADIQSSEIFIRNLEDSEFRDSQGIFCIAETYSPIPTYDDYGIVFLDLSKLKPYPEQE